MRITDKTHILNCVVLFFATLLSRIFLLEKFQSHWDGPQYSIALFRYSIADNTPASPGYPIYIGIGKVFNYFVNNPHLALTFESALFNSIGAVVIYLFARVVFGWRTGLITVLLYITSPVIYFFGLTAYAYGVDVVFYLLFVASAYRLIVMKKNNGTMIGITASLLIGFRPQDLLFIFPLLLYAICLSTKKETIKMMGGFALISFFWVIPLFLVTGGIIPYIHYLSEAASSMRNGAHPSFIEVGKTLAKGFVLTLGLGIIFPFLFLLTNRFKLKKKKYKKLSLFFLFWIIPPFLFNLLIRSDHAGYQLPYLVPLLILCAASLFSLFRKSYYLRFFLIAMVCVNFILFFRNRDINNKNPYIPTSFHYSEILKNDKKMDEKINYIKDNFEPKTTLIVIGDPNYFRPVMYYFPEFNTIQINKLTSKDSNYSNLIREGYQYKMREYKTFKNYYKLKDSISSIVCFDDDCRNWVNKNSNTISFDKYTFIVEIIKNKSNLYYDFGKLTLQ